jgi:hypothetical protein
MNKASGPQVITPAKASKSPLPPAIQGPLGESVGAARERLPGLPRAPSKASRPRSLRSSPPPTLRQILILRSGRRGSSPDPSRGIAQDCPKKLTVLPKYGITCSRASHRDPLSAHLHRDSFSGGPAC